VKRHEVQARGRSGAKAARAHPRPSTPAQFSDFDERPLHRCVETALDSYFAALDGEDACGLYDLVMAEVERPLLASVMRYVANNQSRAAAMLGVSRGTLRKKLVQHGLLES
jgi:Fis family transcriptional regulator, factor for inversion stimulation protein